MAGFEATLRILDLPKSGFRPFLPSLKLHDYYVADPEIGIDIRKNVANGIHVFADSSHRVFSNRLGCFDTGARIPAGYILVIGDSVAWGYAPLDHKWPTRLENILGRRVVKCGVSGTGSRHQITKARRIIEQIGHNPELILVAYTQNDFADDFAFPSDTVVKKYRVRWTKRIDPETGAIQRHTLEELNALTERVILRESGLLHWLRKQSAVANLLSRGYEKIFEETPEKVGTVHRYDLLLWERIGSSAWVDRAWRRHTDALKEMRDLAQETKSNLVILVKESKKFGDITPLLQFLSKNNFSYLDLTSETSKYVADDKLRKLRWRHDRHRNIPGNHLMGAIVATFLLDSGLVTDSDGAVRRAASFEIQKVLDDLGL